MTGRSPEAPLRVLMVDDDDLVLEAQATILRQAGIEVRALSAPDLLLQELDGFAPDLLVLDLHMPGISGLELAAVVREREMESRLPILFLSAEQRRDEQLRALELGGDDFLTKPVEPGHLLAAVTARARRARRESAIRRLVQNLRYEREREHAALDHHAIVSVTDRTGRIIYVNDQFCQISGYARAELLGSNHRLLKSDAHPPDFYRDIWRRIAGGSIWKGVICNRRKDGSPYWVESSIVPFMDQKGRPYRYVSIRTDITHLKQVTAALQASENRLTLLLERSPLVIYSSEAAPPFAATFISANVRHISGHEPSRFIEDPGFWLNQVHPDDRAQALEAIPKALEGGSYRHEYRFRHANGEYRWVHHYLRAFRGEDGKPKELVGYVIDISDRKQVEQTLEVSRERLRRGQIYANVGTWDLDLADGSLVWSERIPALLGYEEGGLETSYDRFLEAVHPEDRQKLIDAVDSALGHDRPYSLEHRVIWPDGTERWLLERGAVIRDAAGEPVRMLGVVQDIDDRKRAELMLVKREAQLLEAQALAHIGNWQRDRATSALTWSDEVYRIFGLEPGTPDQIAFLFWNAVHPDDRASLKRSLKKARQGGGREIVHRIVRPDGSVRHVRLLVRYEPGGARGVLTGTVQDITETVEAEKHLIAARDEADRANAAKSEFLSRMSHELRTPMNAILGFGQLLEHDDVLTEDQAENVHEILKAGRYLLVLIDEVLDLAKIEAGGITLSIEPVAVGAVAEECLDLVAPLARKRGIGLHHAGFGLLKAKADRTRLRQVLLNFLSNAIKYNRDGGSVTVEAREAGRDMLRFLVHDTGPGIPAARMAELFQPFNRLGAETSGIEGTGIGLSITRRLVDMMGGATGASSEPGVGSTFWFELPRAPEGADEQLKIPMRLPPGEQNPADTQNTASVTAKRTSILYIEDNPSNLKLVTQILVRRDDIDLRTAHDGHLGIELACAERPDLILLDINLPGMDGYRVLELIRANTVLRDIPVVAVTANALPRDVESGKTADFDDYLTKPIDLRQFTTLVERYLSNLPAEAKAS